MSKGATDQSHGLLIVMIDIDPSYEDEFNRWYDEEHLPERRGLPGFLSAKRFVSVEGGGPKYLALYELSSVEALETAEYQKLIPPSAWTKEVTAHMTHLFRGVYLEVDPGPDVGPGTP